jgi:hypothetical protein
MEESYQEAVRRETLQNVRSYSFELKYLISGHAIAFQGKERGKSGMGWEGLLGNGVIVGQVRGFDQVRDRGSLSVCKPIWTKRHRPKPQERKWNRESYFIVLG